MKVGSVGLVCLVVGSLFGCSSGDDDSGGDPTPALNPPPNIDANVCASTPVTGSDLSACGTCCNSHSFSSSTEYDGKCVCGNALDTSGDTVCQGSASSESACSSCCDAGEYFGYLYATVGSDMSCTCQSKSNASVCKSSLSAASPPDACEVCCLNHGYLGYFYTGFGTVECRCLDG